MAIVLNNITSGYNLSTINSNFQKIEDYVNDKLLARADTGVAGEAMMERALDMNGNKILNIFVDVNDANSLLTVGVADSRYYNVSGDTLTGPMDANSQIINNLPTPVQPSQPATKAYVDAIQADVDANESHSLRFPDAIEPMVGTPARANSLQGYNNEGNPVPIFSMSDTADLAVKLASTDAGLGGDLVGWKRNPLAATISTISQNANATPISIWEFANLVTDKPTSDPNTWDWAPAITAGILAAAQQTEFPLGSATRYSSWYLDFTPGKYIVRSQVKVDFSSMTFDAGKPLVKIRMNGAYISSAIDQDYAVWFLGCRIDVDEFRFTKEGNISAYYLKLGSEATNNVTAVGGRIGDLRCYYPTKALTFGQGYDLVIDEVYMSGFTAVDDNDTANPATAIHFLSHANDNSNNIVFIRIHLETSLTTNYVAIKADDNQAAGQPHHNIKFLGGHVEPHLRGAKWFDLGISNQINFDTVVFTDNGSNTIDPASYNLGMLATSVQRFDGCTFQTNNLSAVAYNPVVHKSLLKFYAGNATSREFNTCYFATAFANVSGSGNFNAAIDATATTNGNNSYRPNNCSLNNFNRRVSGSSIHSDLSITSRKYLVGVDSTDSSLKWTYNNTDLSYNGGTVAMSLSTAGLLTTSGGFSSGGNIASNAFFQAGVNNTTSGNRDVSFYPYGDNTMSARILADNGGGLTITNNSAAINYVANAGTSAHIFTGTVRPNVTATYNLGSSTITYNNIYLQNAPTVISDSGLKPLQDPITDAEKSVAKDCSKLILKYKLLAAIEEKGTNARYHFGVIAQDIMNSFTAGGLDYNEYGIITTSTVKQKIYQVGDKLYPDGHSEIPVQEDGSILEIESVDVINTEDGELFLTRTVHMVRYEELLCFIISGLYSAIESIEEKLNG